MSLTRPRPTPCPMGIGPWTQRRPTTTRRRSAPQRAVLTAGDLAPAPSRAEMCAPPYLPQVPSRNILHARSGHFVVCTFIGRLHFPDSLLSSVGASWGHLSNEPLAPPELNGDTWESAKLLSSSLAQAENRLAPLSKSTENPVTCHPCTVFPLWEATAVSGLGGPLTVLPPCRATKQNRIKSFHCSKPSPDF